MKALIVGGNRFFGKKLAQQLVEAGHEVTLLNRGNIDDGLVSQVSRLKCDRQDRAGLRTAKGNSEWDVIIDQVCFSAKDAKGA
jgi:nucleoside-diphosphate-sugar epimerase